MPGAGEAGYLRLALAWARSSSRAALSPEAAARAADRTNRVAFPAPAALWIWSRCASVRRKAKTTSGTFGTFSFFGLASFGAFAFFTDLGVLPGAGVAAPVFGVLLVVGSIMVSSLAGKLGCVPGPIPGTG